MESSVCFDKMLSAFGKVEIFTCPDVMLFSFIADDSLAVQCENECFSGCRLFCLLYFYFPAFFHCHARCREITFGLQVKTDSSSYLF